MGYGEREEERKEGEEGEEECQPPEIEGEEGEQFLQIEGEEGEKEGSSHQSEKEN